MEPKIDLEKLLNNGAIIGSDLLGIACILYLFPVVMKR